MPSGERWKLVDGNEEVALDVCRIKAVFMLDSIDNCFKFLRVIPNVDPQMLQFRKEETYKFHPNILVREFNGIVYCEDHDGCSGGTSWGFAIVLDNKLIWKGKSLKTIKCED